MSEMEETEQETTDQNDEAVDLRRDVEVETGALLPRWLSVSIWAVFGPFCIFAAVWIGRAIVIQHNINAYLDVLSGPWEGEPPAMESEVVDNGRESFRGKPRSSLLYIMQRLVVPEIEDPRMARAVTLRKMVNWEVESERRELLAEIAENMNDEGEMAADYELSDNHRDVLNDLVEERKDDDEQSYEQEQITEVLEWILEGRPTPPVGPEKRRVRALQDNYEKRLFMAQEKETLKKLAESWESADDRIRRDMVEKMEEMLEGEVVALTDEEADLCEELAAEAEESYLRGQYRASEVALSLVKYIEENEVFIDHPDIWEVLRLLQHRDPATRENMKDAAYAFRNRQYCLLFLANFLRKNQVNPVMAVETERQTKDEREAQLRRENQRRRLAGLDVARRIAINYCKSPFPIEGVPEDEEREYVKRNVIGPIVELVEDDDEKVAERASEVLEEIQEPCAEYLAEF